MLDFSKMKKAELVVLAEKWGLEHDGLKNDLIRDALSKYQADNLPYDCDSCTWFRPNAELREFNMPGMPGQRADICKYLRTYLLVKQRKCPHYQKDGELSQTSDARINAAKRRAIGE